MSGMSVMWPFIMAYTLSPETLRMPSLAEIFLRWVNTVLMLINRRSAISLLVNPFANRQSTSISRCDSSLPSERLWRDVSIMSPSCFSSLVAMAVERKADIVVG